MVCGVKSLQKVLHPPVDVSVIQCVPVSSIFTLQLKSLFFRGEKRIFLLRSRSLCVTHTFTSQPTQACLGIPSSHFELFPFTSCSLCFLNILLDFLQVNYFWKSDYQSLCPSGSFIFFPAYFFEVLFAVVSLCFSQGKKTSQTACRLNCLEYLGEQQVWGHEKHFLLKNIEQMSVGKFWWCDHLCIDICLLWKAESSIQCFSGNLKCPEWGGLSPLCLVQVWVTQHDPNIWTGGMETPEDMEWVLLGAISDSF